MIGASDTHVGAGAFDEDNYWSKVGLVDNMKKTLTARLIISIISWSASGLAAVWADSNTRGDIFDAMRRKETYATTGPRIKLRFFALISAAILKTAPIEYREGLV